MAEPTRPTAPAKSNAHRRHGSIFDVIDKLNGECHSCVDLTSWFLFAPTQHTLQPVSFTALLLLLL
jgi:hypothetical protein